MNASSEAEPTYPTHLPARRVPPGPTTHGLLLLAAMRHNPTQFLTRLHQEHGDIVKFAIGRFDVYALNRPEWIRDVLVTHGRLFIKGEGLQRAKRMLGEGLLTSEGETHLRQRRLMQPMFLKARIASYAQTMIDEAAATGERWNHSDGQAIDMHAEMMHLTLSVVSKTLFGTDVEAKSREIGQALNIVLEAFNLLTLPFAQLLEKLPLPAVRRMQNARDYLDGLIYDLIEERRRDGLDGGDLLSLLLQTRDENDAAMSDLQVRDEAMTIFLAGHETTSNALSWTWYLLSQNPAVERGFHDEIDAVLGGRRATFEDLEKLIYTRQVLSESMRLFPPAWILGRRALEDYAVEDGGSVYHIPKNALVVMSQWVMHRDARYFPDPERFDPDRWTTDEIAKRPKFSYFPFGAGTRQCIGEGFAWMEGILMLATLGQNWSARLVPDFRVQTQPLVTLRPRHGLQMILHKR